MDAFFKSAERRAFFRAAVFFFITPRFSALSIAWYAAFKASAWPARSLPAVPRALFTDSAIARLRRTLNTRFLMDARCAFFAPFVIAIVDGMYPEISRSASPVASFWRTALLWRCYFMYTDANVIIAAILFTRRAGEAPLRQKSAHRARVISFTHDRFPKRYGARDLARYGRY